MADSAGAVTLFVAFLAIVAGAPAADAQTVRRERLEISGPETTTTAEGSLKGFDTVEYQLAGTAGDTMALSLSADNPQAYFNLYAPDDAPGEGTALFIGVRDGREFSGTLAETGDYTVHVVLMRPAARRGETAEFRLSVELTGTEAGAPEAAGAAAAPAEPETAAARATAPSPRLGMSGHLPCATVAEAPTVPCAYRATRMGGTALVFVRLGNGVERGILFVGGYPVASDRLGAPFSAVRRGGEMLVAIDEERFEIPGILARGR